MKVVSVPREITVSDHYVIDGMTTIEVSCYTLDEYRDLPKAVLFRGKEYSRVGWSRLERTAFYRPPIA